MLVSTCNRPGNPYSVALYGPAGCGKDTIARYLVDIYQFTRIAFADPVREMALAIDPWIDCFDYVERPDHGQPMRVSYNSRLSSLVEKYGWEYTKREYPEVRRLLQAIGTDAVRSQTPDYWVDLAREKAVQCETPVVFTDTRFPNEAEMTRDMGGIVVRIIAEQTLTGREASHVSESSLEGYKPDGTLVNEFTYDLQELDKRMTNFAAIIAEALGLET